MTQWRYIEPTSATDSTPVVFIVTEAEIIATYYAYWANQMRRAGKADEINEHGCVEDFIVVHWAEPVVTTTALVTETPRPEPETP